MPSASPLTWKRPSREAKVHTSWTDPNPAYDKTLRAFVEAILKDAAFHSGFGEIRTAAHRTRPDQFAGPDADEADRARAFPISIREPRSGT